MSRRRRPIFRIETQCPDLMEVPYVEVHGRHIKFLIARRREHTGGSRLVFLLRGAAVAIDIRKGMPSTAISREQFDRRMRSCLIDPAFDPLQDEIAKLIDAAWDGYSNARKAPQTRKAGPGYADPDYDLAADWIAARNAIDEAQKRHDEPARVKRVLLINGSSRSDQTCPGEMSKTYRLCKIAEQALREQDIAVELLDLSRLTSEVGRHIHPCKSCVSTSMALCHWPCSCYPNYSTADIRLDERDLSNVGGSSWRHDHYPGELVPGAKRTEIDD